MILEAAEIAVLVKGKAWVEILKIAVVSGVDRGARMKEIGEEDVRVEIFGGLQ